MKAQAIAFPQGVYNPGGTKRVLYTFAENIATFPVLADPETGTTLESLISFTDPITCKVGEQFYPLYCTVEEGQLKTEMVGPRDGKGFETTLTISFPGNKANFLGFQAAAANRQLIFLVEEKNNVFRVLGSPDDPAYMETAAGDSGKKISDGRKTEMTFKSSGGTPAPIYSSPVTSLLIPAV